LTQVSSPSASRFKETDSGYRYLQIDSSFDLSQLQRANSTRYPFVLESPSRGRNGRFDIAFGFPAERLQLAASGELSFEGKQHSKQFFDLFRESYSTRHINDSGLNSDKFPFSGGWFIYLAYEMVKEIEPTLARLPVDQTLPLAVAVRIPIGIIVDHDNNSTTIIGDPDASMEQLQQCLCDLGQSMEPEHNEQEKLDCITEEESDKYLASVVRAKHYIREGDIFQANLSRQWHARSENNIDAAGLYQRLKVSNPAPFAGLAHLTSQISIISSSPERLVSVRNGRVSTRPIAGTYPRGSNTFEDQTLSRALLAHPKEKAEHIMLIDLERNDLGRICEPGSVKVDELMALETYTHVHHIVSEISGRMRADADPVDVIRAVFPGGTITGCPKIRCMEIIDELESSPRGVYTGSMGYINRDGSLDLNILIRTLVSHNKKITLRAGAGIVADSDPARELAETRAKAEGMLKALETL